MKDYKTSACPEKELARQAIASRSPLHIRRGLWLPSAECVDVSLFKDKGNITDTTEVVVVEKDPATFKLMMHNLKKLGITNLEPHKGEVEDYVNKKPLTFVHVDWCGFFNLRRFKWIAKSIAPFVEKDSVAVFTVMSSYRDEVIMPELVRVCKEKFSEDRADVIGYKTYTDHLAHSLGRTLPFNDQEHLYFVMPHFMLRCIFNLHGLCPMEIINHEYQDTNPMSVFILKDFDNPVCKLPSLYEIIDELPEDIEHIARLKAGDPAITWEEVQKQKAKYLALEEAYNQQQKAIKK